MNVFTLSTIEIYIDESLKKKNLNIMKQHKKIIYRVFHN